MTGQGPSILFVSSVPGIVAGHLSPVASHCCAMAVEVNTMRAWLKERRGGLEPPTEEEANAFLSIAQEGEITADMFVTSNESSEDMRELWTAVVVEAKEKMREAGTGTLSAIKAQKLITWSLRPSRLWAPDPHMGALADAAEAMRKAALTAAALAAQEAHVPPQVHVVKEPEPVVAIEAAVSREQSEDMESQGASRPEQLTQLYVSCQLGRKAGPSECEGMGYMSHWSMAKGMKQISKNPTGLGYKNLPQLLEAAKVDGNLLQLDKFMQRTAEVFMMDPRDVFWMRGGSRLITRWSRAKTVRPLDGRVAAWYFSLFWEEMPGRGMPDLKVDYDLIRDAERAVMALPASPTGQGSLQLGDQPPGWGRGPPSDAGSLSSHSSGLSEAKTEKMMESMSRNLMEVFESKFMNMKSEMDRRHSDVLSKLGRGSGPKGEGQEGTAVQKGKCFACGKRGHQLADCTELAEWKKLGSAKKDDE